MRASALLTHPSLWLLALFATQSAQGAVVSSVPAGLVTSQLTFAPYDAVTTTALVPMPVDVGSVQGLEPVVLSFNDPDAERVLGAVPTSFGSNGQWPYRGAFAGLNVANGSMTLSFGRGLNFVGGFINYDPDAYDGTTSFAALNALGGVIEQTSLDFRFGDPGATGLGQFIGFSYSGADIWAVRLRNGKAAIDNVTFGATAAVPESGTLVMMLVGLGSLAIGLRRTARS